MNRVRKISRCSGCGKDRLMCVSNDGMHFYCNRCGGRFGLGVNRERYYDDNLKSPNPSQTTNDKIFAINNVSRAPTQTTTVPMDGNMKQNIEDAFKLHSPEYSRSKVKPKKK